jgi:hypothetical protein
LRPDCLTYVGLPFGLFHLFLLPVLFPALSWPLLLAVAAGSLAPADNAPAPAAAPLRSRTFSFDYIAKVHDLPAGTKQLDLWLPVPHTDKSQDIENLKVTSPYPYEILTGQYGNKVLHLKVKDPQPAGFAVTMEVKAERREHINPMPSRPRRRPRRPPTPT